MSRLRAVFFDFDGTLHDLRRASTVALGRAVVPIRRGTAPPLADIQRRTDARWHELWPAYVQGVIGEAALYDAWFMEMLAAAGAPVTPAATRKLERSYNAALVREIRPFPDVMPALTSLRAAHPGVVLGILTNGSARYQRARIAATGLDRLLPLQVISGEQGRGKPDPAFFAAGVAAAGVAPEETAMVGDAPEVDVAAAARAGLTAVWVNRSAAPWPEGLEPGPVIVARTVGEAVERLAGRLA